MTAIDIRTAGPADDAEWLRMRLALWPDQSADELHADMATWRAMPNSIVLVVARPDGRLGGFAEVGERSVVDSGDTSPVAYLEGWYVDPDLRRQGVGTALVRAAEAWARERGHREFASDVELVNEISQRAHVALGFAETSRVVNYLKRL